ncbi:MFS general substrate transporter [Hyaloscypha variabilis]
MAFQVDDQLKFSSLRGYEGLEEDTETGLETALLLINSEEPDESTTATLNGPEHEDGSPTSSKGHAAAAISLLLIGVFAANIDSSLVLATKSAISSSFSALQSASWLTTSYVMATCATQPIVGKLSDIFGHKNVLLVSYVLFAIGSGICGAGQSVWQVIIGRSIAGLGGAGMTVIVAVLITDMVPMIQVAFWRSYVNIVATTGRMVGGPLSGWLADLIGWRWSFLGQVPLTLLALSLVAWKFKKTIGLPQGGPVKENGIVLFLPLCSSSSFLDSSSLRQDMLGSLSFPPKLLLRRDVATTYLINIFQSAPQMAIMFSVPLYFQVTTEASNTTAGAHLVPAFVGNTFGSLLAGFYIARTRRYKKLVLLASVSACTAYITIIMRWHGNIHGWEALEIAPGGFASGVTTTSTFIALTADMPHENVAIVTSGFYLPSNLGTVLGVSIVSRRRLGSLMRLGLTYLLQIIQQILADVLYLKKLHGPLKEIVTASYIQSLEYSHIFSLICSSMGFLIALAIREHSIL